MAGETDQWTPYLFRNTTQIFPWLDQPSYNLVGGHGHAAIRHVRPLNAASPNQVFFVHYVPGATHASHQPTTRTGHPAAAPATR